MVDQHIKDFIDHQEHLNDEAYEKHASSEEILFEMEQESRHKKWYRLEKRDEDFVAVNLIDVSFTFSRGLETEGVRPGVGLGERKAEFQLTRRHSRKEATFHFPELCLAFDL